MTAMNFCTFLLFYPPVCSDGAGQPRRVAVQPRRVQPIDVHVAFDRRPVAGVGVRGRASGAGLGRANVALGAGTRAGGLSLYGGGTDGV